MFCDIAMIGGNEDSPIGRSSGLVCSVGGSIPSLHTNFNAPMV